MACARPTSPRGTGLGLARVLLVGLLGLGCGGPRPLDHVPADLLGIWKTSAPRYERNFLQIAPDAFVLGVAGMDLDRLRIEAIDVAEDGEGHPVYRLHYTADEGYADALVLTYVTDAPRSAARRALRIGARPDLWTPSGSR